MKLNIGASNSEGIYRNSEWLNFDLINHKRIDVIGNAIKLPFTENSFDEIHCIHVLEHMTREKQVPVLKEMQRVLKEGCSAYIEVPDIITVAKRMVKAYEDKDFEQSRIWTVSMYGKSEREGMAHHWGFSKHYLATKIAKAGFKAFGFPTEMISSHYKQEPVILIRGIK